MNMFSVLIGGIVLATSAGGTLFVRLVDRSWAPLPGITVRLMGVKNCVNMVRVAGAVWESVSNGDGAVEFQIPGNSSYLVSAGGAGGIEILEQCVRLAEESPAFYVQLRLRSDLSSHVTLLQPAAGGRRSPGRLGLATFTGVYADTVGRFYEVSVAEGGVGLELSLPDGREMVFTIRDGSSFRSSAGVLRFQVSDGRVIAMSVAPRSIQATKSGTER